MAISLGILSWGAHETLRNTLESYQKSGLDRLVNERYIFFQNVGALDLAIAREFGYEAFGANSNIGISEGFKELLNRAVSDQFLFLENDWVNNSSPEQTIEELTNAEMAIAYGDADVVRLRSRDNPGYPLWTLQFKGKEYSKVTHLLDCVHWTPYPTVFPEIKRNGSLYTTTSRYANWTNNPFLARTKWLQKYIIPRLGGDIEKNIQSWWEKQNFKVAQGNGLFTHYRID